MKWKTLPLLVLVTLLFLASFPLSLTEIPFPAIVALQLSGMVLVPVMLYRFLRQSFQKRMKRMV